MLLRIICFLRILATSLQSIVTGRVHRLLFRFMKELTGLNIYVLHAFSNPLAVKKNASMNRKKVEHKNSAGHLQPDSPEIVDLLKQIQISSNFTFYRVELISLTLTVGINSN